MKKFIAAVLTLLVIIGCAGCTKKGSSSSTSLKGEDAKVYSKLLEEQKERIHLQTDIVGTWKSEKGNYITFVNARDAFGKISGNGVISPSGKVKDAKNFSFEIKTSGRLILNIENNGKTVTEEDEYTLENNVLTVTDEYHQTVKYIKQ